MKRLLPIIIPASLFLLLAAGLVLNGSYSWDLSSWKAIQSWRFYGLDQGMHLISLLGSGFGLTLFISVICWWLIRVKPDFNLLKRFLWANVGGAILAWPIKFGFDRPRPDYSTQDRSFDAIGPSFPSGHAMAAILFYGFLAWWLLQNSSRPAAVRWRGALLLVLFGSLSGFSRFYLGDHYLSDVLAGYCVGFAWLGICTLNYSHNQSDQ